MREAKRVKLLGSPIMDDAKIRHQLPEAPEFCFMVLAV